MPGRLRTVLLLFGSVLFVVNATVAVHEMGHLVADRLAGVDARIVLEPFGGSYTDPVGPIPVDDLGWTAAAGPLANIAVGLLLFVSTWPVRGPYLFPLLLWAPMAILQESTTALVQIATSEPGTDFIVIVESGVPQGLIVALAVAGLFAGVIGLGVLTPIVGIPGEERIGSVITTLVLGLGGYYVFAVVALLLSGRGEDAARSASQLALVVVVVAVSALVSRKDFVARLSETMNVPWRAIAVANAAGWGLLGLLFLL